MRQSNTESVVPPRGPPATLLQQAAINGAGGDGTALEKVDFLKSEGAGLRIVIEMAEPVPVVRIVDVVVVATGIMGSQ